MEKRELIDKLEEVRRKLFQAIEGLSQKEVSEIFVGKDNPKFEYFL